MEQKNFNIWDYFKFFPMFESFFGNKNFYLNSPEQTSFSNMSSLVEAKIRMYQDSLKNFTLFQFTGLEKDILELTIQIMYKVVYFPFNFTYYDYSSDPKINEFSMNIFPEQLTTTILDFELHALMHQYYLGCRPSISHPQLLLILYSSIISFWI